MSLIFEWDVDEMGLVDELQHFHFQSIVQEYQSDGLITSHNAFSENTVFLPFWMWAIRALICL